MINNKISVIVPTWNRAHLLKKAIQSALNQTLAPLEIIVSDDGSTDNSYYVVKSLKNHKIKWITANHVGLPAVVRNRAIKESKGEWLAFLDSDDEWFPEKLEKQLALAKRKGSLAICSNAYSLNSKNERKEYLSFSKNTINFSDLLNVNYVICSSAIIHRSLLFKCFGFPEISALKTWQDYAFWLRISTQSTFAYLSEPLVLYFDDPSKSNRKFTKNPYLQKKIILENFLDWSQKNNLSFSYKIRAIKHYLTTLFTLFKNQLLENLKI